MYSRSFSDRAGQLPPSYGGTALTRRGHDEERGEPRHEEGKHREKPPCCEENCHEAPPCQREECHEAPPCQRGGEHCEVPPCPAPGEKERPRGIGIPLLERWLPEGIESGDLLLFALAILLLLDGCEDSTLPLVLLFLLIVR